MKKNCISGFGGSAFIDLKSRRSSVNFLETAISGLLPNSSQLKVFVRVGCTSIYKTLQVIFGGRKIERFRSLWQSSRFHKVPMRANERGNET